MAKAPPTKSLIGLVCLGLLFLIAWLGFFFLREVGRGFANGAPPPDSINYVVIGAAVFSLFFVALALFRRGPRSRVYALAPIALAVLGEILLQVIYSSAASERAERYGARAAAIAAHVAALPQTYVEPGLEYAPSSFLFVDERTGFLMRVGHDADSFEIDCLGSVLNGSLSLEVDLEPPTGEESFLSIYVDEGGRSPADEYELVYVEHLNIILCDYERYELR